VASTSTARSIVPANKQFFKVSGLTKVNQNNNGIYEGPTIISPQTEGNPLYLITNDSFNFAIIMPGGIINKLPLNAVPLPNIQLNLGLPYKTEIMLRLLPKTKFGERNITSNLLGIGLKKEITDWFGEFKNLPLHISIASSYTISNTKYDFSYLSTNSLSVEDGATTFDLEAFNIQTLFSLNFSFVNFYSGIGYGSGHGDLALIGKYIYDKGGPEEEDLIAPRLKFSSTSFKATFGTRLNFNFFKIFADYTFQEYDTISAGIAFSYK